LEKTRRKATYNLSIFQRARHDQVGSLEKTKRKATYLLSRLQRSQAWSGGIIGEDKKKGHLLAVNIAKEPGMVRWDHWRKQEEKALTTCQGCKGARHGQVESLKKTRKKITYKLSRLQRSQAWSGGIIGEKKKKGHLQAVKIAKEPGMVRWDHWRKQEERPLTHCQDCKVARHGQVGSLEKTRRKATYILSRLERSQAWSGGIIEENKKKGHLPTFKIAKEPGMVRWDHWRKQE